MSTFAWVRLRWLGALALGWLTSHRVIAADDIAADEIAAKGTAAAVPGGSEVARDGVAPPVQAPRSVSLVEAVRRCRPLPPDSQLLCLQSATTELQALIQTTEKRPLRVLPSFDEPARRSAPGDGVLESARRLHRQLDRCRTRVCSADDGRQLDSALRTFEAQAANFATLAVREVVLVSRGGVSLGNWQAGFLFALTEGLKERRQWLGLDGPVFPVVTGASAGAVNAIAAAASGCGKKKLDPSQSMYHKVWLPMGLGSRDGVPGLTSGDVGRLHLFSEAALRDTVQRAQDHLEDNEDGIPVASEGRQPCRVLVGLSTTHIDAQRIRIDLNGGAGSPLAGGSNGKLTVSRQKEIFQLELEFRGETGPEALRARNFLHASPGARRLQAVLGHDPHAPVKAELVLAAARASGAFPVAFPPVTLPYTFADGQSEPRTGVFIDGGTFDNMPLGVAVKLHEQLPRHTTVELPPLVTAAQPGVPAVFLLLEPNVESWVARSRPPPGDAPPGDIPGTYLGFANAMISSNKDSGIADALNSYPELLDQQRVFVPKRRLPVAGAFLSAFLAFVERDFREFDYYVGIADALHTLRDYAPLLSGRFAATDSLRRVRDVLKLGEGDAKLTCIVDYFDSAPSREPLISKIDDSQLPASCAPKRVGNFASLLRASHNTKVRSTLNDEKHPYTGDGTAAFIEEAVAAEFEFTDIEEAVAAEFEFTDTDAPEQVLSAIRGIFAGRIGELGDRQNSLLSRRLVGVGGQAAADALTVRRRPRFSTGLGLTQMGFDGYFGWNAQRWWLGRWELGGKIFRFDQSKFDDGETRFRLELMPYSKLSLLRFGDSTFEYSLVAGLGLPYFLALREDVSRYDQLNLWSIGGIELNVFQTVVLRVDGEYRLSTPNLVGDSDAHRVGTDKRFRTFATVALQFNTW